jgi:hypothetical protein
MLSAPRQARRVSLWDILTLLSAPSTCGGVLAAADIQGRSARGLGVGVLLGAGLGFLAMAAAHVAGERAFRQFRLGDDSPRANIGLRALYLAKFAWFLALAPLLGFWSADIILRVALP